MKPIDKANIEMYQCEPNCNLTRHTIIIIENKIKTAHFTIFDLMRYNTYDIT